MHARASRLQESRELLFAKHEVACSHSDRLCAYYLVRVCPRAAQMTVRAAFHVFDKDGSGALSTQELKAVLTRPGGGQPLSDEEVLDIVKEFDLNGDVSASQRMSALQRKAHATRAHSTHLAPLLMPAPNYGYACVTAGHTRLPSGSNLCTPLLYTPLLVCVAWLRVCAHPTLAGRAPVRGVCRHVGQHRQRPR